MAKPVDQNPLRVVIVTQTDILFFMDLLKPRDHDYMAKMKCILDVVKNSTPWSLMNSLKTEVHSFDIILRYLPLEENWLIDKKALLIVETDFQSEIAAIGTTLYYIENWIILIALPIKKNPKIGIIGGN